VNLTQTYNFIQIDNNAWPLQGREYRNSPLWMYYNVFTEKELNILENRLNYYKQYQRDATTSVKDKDKYEINNKIRSSKVVFLDFRDEHLTWFYEKITSIINDANISNFNFNLTGIEPLQFGTYRAEDKGFYNWHVDASSTRTYCNNIRKLSISLLLREPEKDFTGGEFEYTTEENTMPLKRNSIVFFPSFLVHRVKPVTSGTRESIVGWINGPNWV